jgi:hypothetical protein
MFTFRRKMNSFIPSPYQKGMQQPTIQKTHDIVESGRYTRLIKTTYRSQFRSKFTVPKKSKSTTD